MSPAPDAEITLPMIRESLYAAVVADALDSLGFKNAANVRVGKYMELDLKESDKAKAEAEVKQMCEKLLANTIVEEYRYELQ